MAISAGPPDPCNTYSMAISAAPLPMQRKLLLATPDEHSPTHAIITLIIDHPSCWTFYIHAIQTLSGNPSSTHYLYNSWTRPTQAIKTFKCHPSWTRPTQAIKTFKYHPIWTCPTQAINTFKCHPSWTHLTQAINNSLVSISV